MHTLDTMTVCLSLSASDQTLLNYTAMLAEHGIGRTFQFVHVSPPVSGQPVNLAALTETLKSAVAPHLKGRLGNCDCTYHIRQGAPLDGLLAYAAEIPAGILLLGHRESHGGNRSLARRLAMLSPSSVWMVPEHAPSQIRHVLSPIDFSAHSADSLSIATGISQRMGATECAALHIFFDESMLHSDDHVAELRGNERQKFEQFAFPLETHGVQVTPLFEEGNHVSRSILRVATERHCDLIVMSSRGRSTAAAVLLGSETSETLKDSQVPVLVVKHRGARLNFFQMLSDPLLWQKSSPHTN